MDWTALKHALAVHVPITAALLMPVALIAAQRPGRGIKPWWITCRYVAWTGVVVGALAAGTGFWEARSAGLLAEGTWISRGALRTPTPFQFHQWTALASLGLGLLMLRALHRKRQEHQGIGFLGLFLGLLWAATTLAAAYSGTLLRQAPSLALLAKAGKVQQDQPAGTPGIPSRILDYGGLIPIQLEPVKSVPHGGRWIRVWVTPAAEVAYREGQTLPEGALVVMSTVEDRWGRPGYELGPLYAMEVQPGGKPSFTFYWPRVPEARRNETRGAARAYWHGEDGNLKACMTCHAGGTAPVGERSRWVIPRPQPKPEVVPEPE
ncbi:MAG TPA: hypothetical protein VN436_18145 [Holophaga sp.]|nr:hypothetical protein [Holophaga sp.]